MKKTLKAMIDVPREWFAKVWKMKELREWLVALGTLAIFIVIYQNSTLLHVSERAYVGVQGLTADLMHSRVFIMFQNAGNVPADDIKVHIIEQRMAGSKPVDGGHFDLDIGHAVIFKGSEYKIIVPLHNFTQPEVQAILDRRENLFVAGNIQYTDGFGDNSKTDFAFVFDPVPPNGEWVVNPTHTFAELQKMK
jgi:hypothetical protein